LRKDRPETAQRAPERRPRHRCRRIVDGTQRAEIVAVDQRQIEYLLHEGGRQMQLGDALALDGVGHHACIE